MTSDLKQLSEAAVPGEWRKLGSIAGAVYTDKSAIQQGSNFNSPLACTLVNAYRAGKLVEIDGPEVQALLKAERERAAKIARIFVDRRLYRPDHPVTSHTSDWISEAILNVTDEELQAAIDEIPTARALTQEDTA